MNKNINNDEIKCFCPWCMGYAHLCEFESIRSNGKWYYINCGNFDCPIMPQSHKKYRNKQEAIKSWINLYKTKN